MIQLGPDPRKWPEPYKSRYAERLRASQSVEILADVPSTDRHLQQQAFVESTAKRNVVRAGRRGGKAQPLTAKVYTPTGPRMMGDLRVGDKVLIPSGGVALIDDIFPQGEVDIFRVTFGDGTSAECTADHLWEIQESRADSKWKERRRVVTTKYLSRMATVIQTGRGTNRRPSIPPTKPTAYCGQPVPLDPYLLGVLLGDGMMRGESVLVSSADEYILERIRNVLPCGVSLTYRHQHDYCMNVGVGVQFNPIIRALKHLELWGKCSYDKFIPEIYRYNSTEVRLEVLRGLLDTDGWVDHNGQPRLEQTSKQLAADFEEVVQSLGGLCTLKTKMGGYQVNGQRKDTRMVYRQAVMFEDAARLFSLPRKKAQTKPRVWPVKRTVHSVEPIGCAAAQCIQISDERGLYLTDNLIATHNTYGVAIRALKCFLAGKRVLYAAPTLEQVDRFWTVVTRALGRAIKEKQIYKNESRHLISREGSEARIRAKTAWNADSLRGDYADELILDEWQLMNEDAWRLVGAPMLIDNNGNATFIYTPPSLHSRSVSKADDPQHAAKLFKKAQLDQSGRWKVFHFGSRENPYIDATAIEELAQDMTALAYRMEIEAEDVDEAPGALWTRATIERGRLTEADLPDFESIVVAVDPSATADGDEAGIMVVGCADGHGYLLADVSKQGSPAQWAETAISAFHYYDADRIVAEANNGGEMVSLTLNTVDPRVPVTLVHASRGKQTRAEPVAALAEHTRLHHVGSFPLLEDELCLWMPGDDSPNRLDAFVWGVTALKLFKWMERPRTRKEMVYRAIPDKYKPETLKTNYSHAQEMAVNFQYERAKQSIKPLVQEFNEWLEPVEEREEG